MRGPVPRRAVSSEGCPGWFAGELAGQVLGANGKTLSQAPDFTPLAEPHKHTKRSWEASKPPRGSLEGPLGQNLLSPWPAAD